jgi:hypothetical protein
LRAGPSHPGAGAWSLRPGSHVASRRAGVADDPYYVALAKEWGVALVVPPDYFFQVALLWSGTHDQRTALDWLANFDAHEDEVEVLRTVYGTHTALWMRRWRWFFLVTSGLFGYADGSEWGVSHYRIRAT